MPNKEKYLIEEVRFVLGLHHRDRVKRGRCSQQARGGEVCKS